MPGPWLTPEEEFALAALGDTITYAAPASEWSLAANLKPPSQLHIRQRRAAAANDSRRQQQQRRRLCRARHGVGHASAPSAACVGASAPCFDHDSGAPCVVANSSSLPSGDVLQYSPRCPVAAPCSNMSATSGVASPLPYASVMDFNVLRYASYVGFNQTVYLRFANGSRSDEKAAGWHRGGAHTRARGAAAAMPRRGGVPHRLNV